jgi:hypothetical protein
MIVWAVLFVIAGVICFLLLSRTKHSDVDEPASAASAA